MKIQLVILSIILVSCGGEPAKKDDPVTQKANNNEVLDSIPKKESNEEEILVIFKSTWVGNKGGVLYSEKVEDIMHQKQLEFDRGEGSPTSDFLDKDQLKSLKTNELIYYCLAYPCYVNQNCISYGLPSEGEMSIVPTLPSNEHQLSLIQVKEMGKRRDSVVPILIREIENDPIVHLEILRMINQLELTECIPVLCKKADFAENAGCYTVLVGMLRLAEYKPYENSALYEKLAEMYSSAGKANVNMKEAQELKKFAMDLHKEKHNK